MSVAIKRAPNPTDADLDQYTKVAAEAFDYSYFSSGLAKDRSLQEPFLRAHMTGALVDGAGEVHIAELPDIGVIGVSVWFGPGHVFLESDSQRNAGYNQVILKLPQEHQEWWPKFFEQYGGLSEKLLGPGVKRGGFHLQLIGILPAHQGKGIGTALVRFGEEKARALHVPSVLETGGDDNITYYKAIGYTLAGTGPIDAPPPSTGTFEMGVFIKHTEDD